MKSEINVEHKKPIYKLSRVIKALKWLELKQFVWSASDQ